MIQLSHLIIMQPNQKTKPLCKFFQLNKCQFGEKCINLHTISKPTQILEKKSSNTPVEKKSASTYLLGLSESLKQNCQGCQENKMRVYLSCGCHDLCE